MSATPSVTPASSRTLARPEPLPASESDVMGVGVPRRDGLTDKQRETLMQPYFQRLIDSGEFPHLAPILKGGIPAHAMTFEHGLDWLLDGIARSLEEH
jgi:hypothetical protein